MRRLCVVVIATLATGFISQSSNAAELPLKAPAATSAYNWSGFYVGANAGYGYANADWTNQQSTPAATFFDALPGDIFSNRVSGIIGGGQIGYNFQNGQWVYGVEATLDASAITGKQISTFGAADDHFETRIRALLLASGRIGFAWDNFLAYGKAGYALANIKTSVSDMVGPSTGDGSDSQWRSGPTVGLGFEYGVAPNISLGLEYDYIRLNSASYQLGGGAGSYLWDVDVRNVSVVMVRFNYRFAAIR